MFYGYNISNEMYFIKTVSDLNSSKDNVNNLKKICFVLLYKYICRWYLY